MDSLQPFSDILHNLYDFMQKGTFTDVIFKIGDREFTAHKNVLAASSSVFRAMFTGGMKESGSNTVVDLTDVDPDAFDVFLDYIYSRNETIVRGNFEGVLKIADKYDVESLAALCDRSLKAQLDITNAIDTLIVADKYNRKSLKSEVSLFIKTNRDAVSSLESWKKLESNLTLFDGLLHSFVHPPVKCSPLGPRVASTANKLIWTVDNWSAKTANTFIKPEVKLSLPGDDISVSIDFYVSFFMSSTCVPQIQVRGNHNLASIPLTVKVKYRKDGLLVSCCTLHWVSSKKGTCSLNVLENLNSNFIFPFDLIIFLEKKPTSDFLFSPGNTDVAKLILENDVIYVQKSVLADSSEFFSNLFNKKRVIEEYCLQGISAPTLHLLLEFMNSHKMVASEDVDLPLVKGARRFKLHDLVDHCEKVLSSQIALWNVEEMYATAEELGLKELWKSAKKFIEENANSLVDKGNLETTTKPVFLKTLFLNADLPQE